MIFALRKWKEGDKCKKFRLLKKHITGRTLCLADVDSTITPDGGSVNDTAFVDRYSGSVFNSEQKAKIRNRYDRCANDAQAYMEENGNALWNEWHESQAE